MSGPSALRDRVAEALSPHGLFLRGTIGFHASDPGPRLADGSPAGCVMLVGPIGGSLWPAFCRWREGQTDRGGRDPLDLWSKSVLGALADELGATAYFPSDPPYQPFQAWAMRAEGLKASPLGVLIHPRYGLWHSYRGALAFAEAPGNGVNESPAAHACDSCADKPCLTHCPVGAVGQKGFDVRACRAHLQTVAGQQGCMRQGCLARNACPVGRGFAYPGPQLRFHMQALGPAPK
jgi:hypothetical protein